MGLKKAFQLLLLAVKRLLVYRGEIECLKKENTILVELV